MKNHFHINGFALSLALKVRFFGTRKWPTLDAPVLLPKYAFNIILREFNRFCRHQKAYLQRLVTGGFHVYQTLRFSFTEICKSMVY